MTTAKEARQLRERVYNLHLQRLSQAEISTIVGLDESNVSRHLARMRRENEKWYDELKEPDGRARSVFKELLDENDRLVRRAEVEWQRAVNPQPTERNPNPQPTSVQNRIGLLNTLRSLQAEKRLILGQRGITMDEVYYREQIAELN